MTTNDLMNWARENLALLWPILSALLVMMLRSRTPEAWVALGERSPRLQGVIRLLRALGLDPVKAFAALVQIVTARVPTAPIALPQQPPAPPTPTTTNGQNNGGAS